MANVRANVIAVAVVMVVVVSCIVGAIHVRSITARQDNSTDVELSVEPTSVRAIDIQPRTVPVRFEVRGFLRAFEEVTVHAEVDGRVLTRLVDEGTVVGKGQKLFELDTTFRDLTVKQLEAGVRQAGEVQKGAKAGLDAARGRVAEAEAGQENAVNEYERIKRLQKQGNAVPVEVDRIMTHKRRCDALMRQANAGLAASVSKRDAADAALSLTEAQLEEAREYRKRCVIVSPLDGVVSMVGIEAGEYARPTQPVCEVIRTDRFKLTVELSGRQAVRIKNATKGTIIPDALPDTSFEGTVFRVGPRANPMSKKFPVELHVSNTPERRLMAGMFCRCVVPAGQMENILALPREAVIEQYGADYCYLAEPSDSGLTARMARIEIRDLPGAADQVEVVAGLEAGTRVLTTAVEQLRDGQSIRLERSIDLAAGAKQGRTDTTP